MAETPNVQTERSGKCMSNRSSVRELRQRPKAARSQSLTLAPTHLWIGATALVQELVVDETTLAKPSQSPAEETNNRRKQV